MTMRFGWCLAGALLALSIGCKSKSDGSSSGGGDGDGDSPGGAPGDGDGDSDRGDGDGDGDGDSGDGDGDGDGDSTVSIEPESGERLQLQMWSGGGIEWAKAVHDVELDAPCHFAMATDGDLYCFPGYEAASASVQVVFTDEDCTEVVGRAWESDCTQLARYTMLQEVSDCHPRQYTAYEVGAEVDLPETIYERDYQGNCVATDTMGQGHELTEIPIQDLVGVSSEIAPRTRDLGVLLYVSEDGLRLPMSAYDVEGDFTCYYQSVGPRGDSTDVCVGNLAYTDSLGSYGFSDDSCEELAAGSTQCREPSYIMAYSQVNECWETELLEVGNQVDELHSITEEMCAPAAESYYHAFYEVGEALEVAELPVIELSHEGGSRLVRETYLREGMQVYSTNNIWDTSLSEYCYPRVINGTTYCLPNGTAEMGPTGSWFADDACTEPLQYYTESECYENAIFMIATWSEQGACAATELDRLYSVEVHDEDVIYVIGPEGDCVEEPAVEDAIYFKAGDELDPSEVLAELSLDE